LPENLLTFFVENFLEIIDFITEYLQKIGGLFNNTIISVGNFSISLGTILYFFISIVLLIWISGVFKRLVVKRIFGRYISDQGLTESLATASRYFILVIGFLIIVQTAGIDLSTLTVLGGALGVGIGFGLQNITNNFISGIIILFERPIKPGDRIEVGQIRGDVVKIAARSTTVVTNDNISVIVPNSEFISSTVINWSHNDRNVRFNFPVGVAYKEDPQKIKRLLMEVAQEEEGVLKKPQPDVLFDEFGESSLNFILRVWTSEFTDKPLVLKSRLYYAIFEKFKQNDIEIPYPQRDLHLRTGFEKLEKS
jgi:small-conductance mechanosensitive channel